MDNIKIWILLIFVAAVLFFPIKVACGEPRGTCLSPPDSQGFTKSYYEIEPMGIYFVEWLLERDIPNYYYQSGTNVGRLIN